MRNISLKPLLVFLLLILCLAFAASSVEATSHQLPPCFGFGDSACDPSGGGDSADGGSGGIGKIDETQLGIPTDINGIVGGVIQLVYAVAGIAFFFMFILGGLRYLLAGGDEKAATAARATLTQAFIGLIIIVAAFLITQLVFNLFGIGGFIKFG